MYLWAGPGLRLLCETKLFLFHWPSGNLSDLGRTGLGAIPPADAPPSRNKHLQIANVSGACVRHTHEAEDVYLAMDLVMAAVFTSPPARMFETCPQIIEDFPIPLIDNDPLKDLSTSSIVQARMNGLRPQQLGSQTHVSTSSLALFVPTVLSHAPRIAIHV